MFVSNKELIDEITRDTVRILLEEEGEKMRSTLESRNYSIFYGAPTVIFIFADGENHWSPIDCGIAVENLALEAQSEGLGSCIIGLVARAFEKNPELYAKMGVPDGFKFFISIAVGNPAMTKPAHELDREKISVID